MLYYLTRRRDTARLEVTLRKHFLAGNRWARFAQDHRWREDDPFAGVEARGDRDTRNELVLTRDEVAAFLREADEHHTLGNLARLRLDQVL